MEKKKILSTITLVATIVAIAAMMLYIVLEQEKIKNMMYEPTDIQNVVITLKRSTCFGICTTYNITIYGNGTVIYEGTANVNMTGIQISNNAEDNLRSGLKSTANLTALGRAVSCFEAEPRLRGPDDMAIRFLDPPLSLVPRSRLLRRLAILLYERLLPGAYLYTIARTQYIDAVLRQELENGIRQIVILGAGFDSRAYRFHKSFPDARFIEVDYPANSMRKAQKVSMLLGSPPDYVTFLPLDMNAESLDSGLSRAGQDPSQRTLFVAEGLTMYLTARVALPPRNPPVPRSV